MGDLSQNKTPQCSTVWPICITFTKSLLIVSKSKLGDKLVSLTGIKPLLLGGTNYSSDALP